MSRLAITAHTVSDTATRLELSGELDLAAVDQLAATIERAIVGDRDGELTVDLDQLDFMDSSVPGALIAGRHLAAEHGAVLRLVHPRGIVRRVLEVTGVLDVLTGAAR